MTRRDSRAWPASRTGHSACRRSQPNPTQGRPLRRRRLDRHHRHHGADLAHPRRASATSRATRCWRCRSPTLAQEQGHRRLPRQLDADHGRRPPALSSTTRSVEVIAKPNLEGAKYTLAVPTYTFEAGLKSFGDIAKLQGRARRQDLRHRAGNDGNRLIIGMIDNNQFDLGGLRAGRVERAGHACRGRPRHQPPRAGGVPRLGAAPDERQFPDEVSGRAATTSSARTSAAPRCSPTSAPATLTECPNVGKPG